VPQHLRGFAALVQHLDQAGEALCRVVRGGERDRLPARLVEHFQPQHRRAPGQPQRARDFVRRRALARREQLLARQQPLLLQVLGEARAARQRVIDHLLADERTLALLDVHQPLVHQLGHRLAQRVAVDAEAARQFVLARQLSAVRVDAIADLGGELLGDLLPHGDAAGAPDRACRRSESTCHLRFMLSG
jgi:hypothetical protein